VGEGGIGILNLAHKEARAVAKAVEEVGVLGGKDSAL